MTSPIGFRSGNTTDSSGITVEVRPADGSATLREAAPSNSRVSDYAYRIAAVTTGIALLASIW